LVLCPKCGRRVPRGASFCPDCGAPIRKPPTVTRSGYLTAAGVLTIISACICILLGILYTVVYIDGVYRGYRVHPPEYFLAGIFGLLGFAYGLTAGILALKRRMFPVAIIGMALVMVAGVLSFVEPFIGIIFGLPMLVLVILAVIFTGISKREFT
jgi:hypothetical protein